MITQFCINENVEECWERLFPAKNVFFAEAKFSRLISYLSILDLNYKIEPLIKLSNSLFCTKPVLQCCIDFIRQPSIPIFFLTFYRAFTHDHYRFWFNSGNPVRNTTIVFIYYSARGFFLTTLKIILLNAGKKIHLYICISVVFVELDTLGQFRLNQFSKICSLREKKKHGIIENIFFKLISSKSRYKYFHIKLI